MNKKKEFTCFAFTKARHFRIRTYLRLCQEIKRRVRVVSGVPSKSSSLRLVSAILTKICERWEYEGLYLRLDTY
jgi:transposase-like protein